MKPETVERVRLWRRQRAHDDDPAGQPTKHAIAIADLIGALCLNLHQTELLKRDQFIDGLLALSRDLLSDRGYDEIDLSDLSEYTRKETVNLIMVAGCQSPDILASRMRATVDLVEELLNLRRDVEVVFSGSSPGGSVRIRNESTRMRILFRQLAREQLKSFDISKLMHATETLEPTARSTAENVREFLALKATRVASPCSIFVVTSTFHVNRVCGTLEAALGELAANGIAQLVDQIVAVGAEPVTANRVSMLPAYVRSMSFECARAALERSDFWPNGD